ncbi:MAG: outer membrane protein assembly factor BamE [Alphaproteobacteria bacterium]|nr:outer membrane protein assembly factor BamE [Alphaproteobacteria bacterium]
MATRTLAIAFVAILAVSGCRATRDFHGYVPDQALPTDVQPTVDTRSTVLARLGSPSTSSIFDDNLWVYMSSTRELLAFYYPKVVAREIVAIQFDDQDVVSDVLVYDVEDGQVVDYNSSVTPTRGRELGILEQLFGTIGRLPQQLPGQTQPGQDQPGDAPQRRN